MNALIRPVALAFVGGLLWAACGSDSSGTDDGVALCKQGCAKTQMCFADAGVTIDCDKQCAPRDGGGGGTSCTNESEITAAYKACLDKSCEELFSCIEKIPPCQGGTGGTGGAGGTGGTGGTGTGGGGTGGGGTGGSSDAGGKTCADILACCNAASDQLKPTCMMAYTTAMGQGDAFCGTIYPQIKQTFCP